MTIYQSLRRDAFRCFYINYGVAHCTLEMMMLISHPIIPDRTTVSKAAYLSNLNEQVQIPVDSSQADACNPLTYFLIDPVSSGMTIGRPDSIQYLFSLFAVMHLSESKKKPEQKQ